MWRLIFPKVFLVSLSTGWNKELDSSLFRGSCSSFAVQSAVSRVGMPGRFLVWLSVHACRRAGTCTRRWFGHRCCNCYWVLGLSCNSAKRSGVHGSVRWSTIRCNRRHSREEATAVLHSREAAQCGHGEPLDISKVERLKKKTQGSELLLTKNWKSPFLDQKCFIPLWSMAVYGN